MSFILDGQGARDVVGAPLQRLDQPCLESETGDSPGSLHVAFAPPKSHTRYQIKPKVDHLLASAEQFQDGHLPNLAYRFACMTPQWLYHIGKPHL